MKRSIGIVATLGTVVALGFISVNLAQRGLRSLGTQFGGAVVSQTTSTPVDVQPDDEIATGPNQVIVTQGQPVEPFTDNYEGLPETTLDDSANLGETIPIGPGLDFTQSDAVPGKFPTPSNGLFPSSPVVTATGNSSVDGNQGTENNLTAFPSAEETPLVPSFSEDSGPQTTPNLLPELPLPSPNENDFDTPFTEQVDTAIDLTNGSETISEENQVDNLTPTFSDLENSSPAIQLDDNSEELPSADPFTANTPIANQNPVRDKTKTGEGVVDETVLGLQTPSLTLEKVAPPMVKLGEPFTYEIIVRNIGAIDAHNIEIWDLVPASTELIRTIPDAEISGSQLSWKFKTLDSSEEKRILVKVNPVNEGTVGSVAEVRFSARAASSTVIAQPKLSMEVSGPGQVQLGEPITFTFHVSNSGNASATGLVLVDRLPAEFTHPSGEEIEYEIGTIKPGETREVHLSVLAAQRGRGLNRAFIVGDGNLEESADAEVNIIAPQLDINVTGPRRRYLKRKANYSIDLANPGDALATNVHVISRVPPGMDFVEASLQGNFDHQSRHIVWDIPQLAAGTNTTIEFTLMPMKIGTQKQHIEATAEPGLSVQSELTTDVQGIAAMMLEVIDLEDPIEIDASTTYEIRVVSQGSQSCTNVKLVAEIPAGLQVVNTKGPTKATVSDTQVVFDPLPKVGPGVDVIYRIQAKGVQPGDQRFKVRVTTDELKKPIHEEESTNVYSDF